MLTKQPPSNQWKHISFPQNITWSSYIEFQKHLKCTKRSKNQSEQLRIKHSYRFGFGPLYCSEFGLRDLTWCNGACAWRLTTATIALPLLSPEMMALPRQRWTMNPEVRETVVRMMKMSFPSEQRRWRGSDSGHCSLSLRGRFWPSQSSICLLCSHWVLRNKP